MQHENERAIILSDSASSLEAIMDCLDDRFPSVNECFFTLSYADAEKKISADEPQLLVVDISGARHGTMFRFVERQREKNPQLVCVCVTPIETAGPFEAVVKKYEERDMIETLMNLINAFLFGELNRKDL